MLHYLRIRGNPGGTKGSRCYGRCRNPHNGGGAFSRKCNCHRGAVRSHAASVWSQATEVAAPANALSDQEVVLNGISCTSGSCIAVGEYADSADDQQLMVATGSSGSWGAAFELTPPANAAADPNASFYGISCVSSGNCTAVGGYEDSSDNNQPLVDDEIAGSWGAAFELTPPANAAADPNASFYGISCVSSGNCVAAGTYFDSSGNTQPMTATETAGSWAPATEITVPANSAPDPSARFNGVSCPSAGDCTAVGSYWDGTTRRPMVATETSDTWGQAFEVTTTNSGELNAVCPTPDNCTAAGEADDDGFGDEQPMTATETSGTWGPPSGMTLPGQTDSFGTSFSGISCLAPGDCSAVGSYYDGGENEYPLAATETSSTWAPTIQLSGPFKSGR